jgi:sec-independent protein translocase protein TatB
MGSPPPVMMANLGMWDSLILMVLALVVLGPRRLPELGRQIGKLMYEFRKASNDFKFQMEEELRQSEEADRRKKEEAERQRALAAAAPVPQLAAPTETPVTPSEPVAPPEPPAEIAADVPAPASASSTESTPDFDPVVESPRPVGSLTDLSPSEPAAASSPVPSSETPHPRIAPPSTGETVAAGRPGARATQQELFAEESPKAPVSVDPDSETSQPAEHHATHNG